MKMYCITFRSITPAQRGQRLLQAKGLRCVLQRTPRWMEARGCGYCLRLRPEDANVAAALLREENLPFSKIYAEENGTATEVML